MKRHNDPPPDPERAALEQQVESLRRDIRKLQLEHDILKKANELIKKGLGVDPQLLTNLEKTLLVDALRQTYELSEFFVNLTWLSAPASTTERACKTLKNMLMRGLLWQMSLSSITVATGIDGYGQHWEGSGTGKTAALLVRKSRPAFNFARMLGGCHYEAASVRLLLRRNQPCPRQSRQPRLPGCNAERKVAYRHHGVPDSGWQGMPLSHDRLRRWAGDQLVNRNTSRRRSCEHYARCCHRKSRQ